MECLVMIFPGGYEMNGSYPINQLLVSGDGVNILNLAFPYLSGRINFQHTLSCLEVVLLDLGISVCTYKHSTTRYLSSKRF